MILRPCGRRRGPFHDVGKLRNNFWRGGWRIGLDQSLARVRDVHGDGNNRLPRMVRVRALLLDRFARVSRRAYRLGYRRGSAQGDSRKVLRRLYHATSICTGARVVFGSGRKPHMGSTRMMTATTCHKHDAPKALAGSFPRIHSTRRTASPGTGPSSAMRGVENESRRLDQNPYQGDSHRTLRSSAGERAGVCSAAGKPGTSSRALGAAGCMGRSIILDEIGCAALGCGCQAIKTQGGIALLHKPRAFEPVESLRQFRSCDGARRSPCRAGRSDARRREIRACAGVRRHRHRADRGR